MGKRREIVGIVWWDTEEEYLKGAKIAEDYTGESYAEWKASAQKLIRNFSVFQRKTVRRVSMNAEKLRAYCRESGLKVDAYGRQMYIGYVMSGDHAAREQGCRPSFATTPTEWFESEEEFQRFLAVWEDPTFSWGTYASWKTQAEKAIRDFQLTGERLLIKVPIHATELVTFCRANNLRVNIAGLDAFRDHKLIKRYESKGYVRTDGDDDRKKEG